VSSVACFVGMHACSPNPRNWVPCYQSTNIRPCDRHSTNLCRSAALFEADGTVNVIKLNAAIIWDTDVSAVHIRTTRHHIPEDGNIRNYRCENLKSRSMINQRVIRIKHVYITNKQTNKQTPWPLVCKRTVPTEPPPLVDEI
jgi:hypothetical protein